MQSDENIDWLSLFKNQESIKPRVTKYLPNRTAFMLHLGFSDFSELRRNWVERKFAQDSVVMDYSLKKWDTLYDVSIELDFLARHITEYSHGMSSNNISEKGRESALYASSLSIPCIP